MAGRKKHGYVPRRTGWGGPIREKSSRYADKGFQYEVRLTQELRWPQHIDPTPYADLIGELQRLIDCRIVGQAGHMTGRKRWSIRLYLRTEQDLFAVRLLTSAVFRVYRLTPKSGPFDSHDVVVEP